MSVVLAADRLAAREECLPVNSKSEHSGLQWGDEVSPSPVLNSRNQTLALFSFSFHKLI